MNHYSITFVTATARYISTQIALDGVGGLRAFVTDRVAKEQEPIVAVFAYDNDSGMLHHDVNPDACSGVRFGFKGPSVDWD